jgi:WD40 repeat protein
VAFSPVGTWVVTGSTDETARVFEATPGLLVQRALRVMDRPLKRAELRRYSLPPDCRHIREWNRLRGRHVPRNPAGN